MRRLPIAGLVCAILTLPITSNSETKSKPVYDVRKVRWGMTKTQVTASESWKLKTDNDSTHVYVGVLFNKSCVLGYSYDGGVLSGITYGIGDSDKFVYESVTGHLTRKYGNPTGNDGSYTHIWLVGGRTTIVAKYNLYQDAVTIGYVDAREDATWKKMQRDEADDAF